MGGIHTLREGGGCSNLINCHETTLDFLHLLNFQTRRSRIASNWTQEARLGHSVWQCIVEVYRWCKCGCLALTWNGACVPRPGS